MLGIFKYVMSFNEFVIRFLDLVKKGCYFIQQSDRWKIFRPQCFGYLS